MGCQIYASGDHSISLQWSKTGYLVMALTRRWLDRERDCDSDGWYQDKIDATSMEKLDGEAPTDVDAFRAYCREHDGIDVDNMAYQELAQVRAFIAAAARAGGGVWCSH